MTTIRKKPHNWSTANWQAWAKDEAEATTSQDEIIGYLVRENAVAADEDVATVKSKVLSAQGQIKTMSLEPDVTHHEAEGDQPADEPTQDKTSIQNDTPEVTKGLAESTPSTAPATKRKDKPKPKMPPIPDQQPIDQPVASDQIFHMPAVSDTHEAVRSSLQAYAEQMQPNRPTPADKGVQQQRRLRRVLLAALDAPAAEFNSIWGEILAFAHHHRTGCFDEHYLFRFINQLTELSVNDRRLFENLLNVILVTADPDLRSMASQQLDLEQVSRYLDDPSIIQKLHAFYSGGPI